MRCDLFRTACSARLDGEDPGMDEQVLDAHLAGCADCRSFSTRAEALHRVVRVQPASGVPALTGAILEQVTAPTPPRTWVRYGVLAVGLTMLALAIPELFTPVGDGDAHLVRHDGAWSIALGLALLAVAIRPARARGLLPLASALAGVMVFIAAVDVLAGHAPVLGEGVHILELVAVVLLWLESREAAHTDLGPLVAWPGRHIGTA